jgi:hypothetical protein
MAEMTPKIRVLKYKTNKVCDILNKRRKISKNNSSVRSPTALEVHFLQVVI